MASTSKFGPSRPAHGTKFPPIAEYAALSDCETTALVAPSGSVDWLCLPSVDSPSVFGALLDRDAGSFRLGPVDVTTPASRRYLPGTMVLETSWGTGSGWMVVRDVLLIGGWRHEDERSHSHQRVPTDYDAGHVLLRTMRCVNGEVEVTLDCSPKLDYGRLPVIWEYTESGYDEGIAYADGSAVQLRLRTDLRLGLDGPSATARHRLKEGEVCYCALSWSQEPPPQNYQEAYRGWCGRPTIGNTGLTEAAFPTIAGDLTYSAAR